jgi:phosphoserine phosphatase
MDVKAVVFDCDGVLVDAQSSWAIIHNHFGTDSSEMLERFMRREISDEEFMADDIRQWKMVQPKIHRDDLFRCYGGLQLMRGARELVNALRERSIVTTIVSAGVDLFISTIAQMLEIDDWAANGFEFDDSGWLQDSGVVRVPAHHKGELVEKLCRINGLAPIEVVSIGDSRSDLSMRIKGSNFIGFSPNHEACRLAFEEAGVPIVDGKDCRALWPMIFSGENFPV